MQGSAFTRGRNATVNLTLDRDNFQLELLERGSSVEGSQARVQYRGTLIRRNPSTPNSVNFTLDGRLRSVTSSANLRSLNNTTGICRIEYFNARVISSKTPTVITKLNQQ